MCKKFRNRIFGGQSVRESWEIVEAKDRISSTKLFDHMVNPIRRGAKKVLGKAKTYPILQNLFFCLF